jgi:two-component system, LytTR family, sensor kinase
MITIKTKYFLPTFVSLQMKIAIQKERFKIFLWIGFVYLLLWVFRDLVYTDDAFLKRVWNNIWLVSALVVINYYFLEHGIKWIGFSWKKMLRAPFILFGFLMLYSFGFYLWRGIGIGLHLYFPLLKHASVEKAMEYHMPYSFLSIPFFAAIRHVHDYRKLKADTQQLRLEKQEAELNYLKSQTNPHFLFNTLNNIYSLARDKSDLAPDSILRLSKILRFMLYETSGEYIALEQEIKVMHDYIELEKLRYDESLRINILHDVEDMRQAIPPLLLIPLVENAFKHGVSETRGGAFVDIHISLSKRILVFTVKNSSDISEESVVKENIGLSNLRRQLKLLYNEYTLTVEPHGGVFTAMLRINLASHV